MTASDENRQRPAMTNDERPAMNIAGDGSTEAFGPEGSGPEGLTEVSSRGTARLSGSAERSPSKPSPKSSSPGVMDLGAWRRELAPEYYDFRRIYGPVHPKQRRHIRDVLDLVALWNKRMKRPGKGGRNRVRVLTRERFGAVAKLLEVFGPDEIASAIDVYSSAGWQRRHGAWMTFDHFFTAARITPWIEQAIERAERRVLEATGRLQEDPRVAKLAEQVAERTRLSDEKARLKALFAALTDEQKQALCHDARLELLRLGRGRLGLTDYAVKMQALVILKREQQKEADQ